MAEEQKTPKPEEFVEIGGSPTPGITLRQILVMEAAIDNLHWSPDGRFIACSGQNLLLLDTETMKVRKLDDADRTACAWSPNGKSFISIRPDAGQSRSTINVWEPATWNIIKTTKMDGSIYHVDWSPDGKMLAIGLDKNVLVCDSDSLKTLMNIDLNHGLLWHSSWSQNSQYISVAQGDKDLFIFDVLKQKVLHTLSEHTRFVLSMAWSPDGQTIASGSGDKRIMLWDSQTGQLKRILESHTDEIKDIRFFSDGKLMISRGGIGDSTIKIWETKQWTVLAEIVELAQNAWVRKGLSIHPNNHMFATLGNSDTNIRIWDIEYSTLASNTTTEAPVHYTTAKLVLVGDSGVGKTGLGWRLAHSEFKEHSSTHGQQFWVIPELNKTRDDGTECEAVLWDLAGQPDYRLVHSLYLDDVDTALVLFDPTNRQEPLSGVDFWFNQLKDKDKKLRNSILVGARIDRGTSTLTNEEIEAYCNRNGITGGYVPTSAKEGGGLPELIERLKSQIPWDQMTPTVTTVTFKRIKEFVLSLKEKPDRKGVLVSPDNLQMMLVASDENWNFSDAEMMTAVGHLEHHGYVKIIHSSNGQHSILLAPDILANIASSIVLEARRNPRGLGVLEEERLLRGEYPFPELNNISKEEGIVLLDAAAVLFLQRNLCFRETFNNQTFLVFPSLINEKRPVDETIKVEEGASYRVKGAVENVYASLVVLLGYTNTFTRTHQWQNQAQYEMGEGEICGFIQSEYRNGEIELVLYYGQQTPDPVRLVFRGLFERFLSRRELEISRYQPINCHKCGTPLARNVVMDQLAKKKDFSFCHECGEKLHLPSPEPVSRLSRREEVMIDVQQAVAQRRTAFEAALVRVKGLLRDQGVDKAPTCFISYSWGIPEHERWVVQFAKDLRNAGIDVLLDRWHSPMGSDLGRFTDQIMKSNFVAVVGTPQLLKKYETQQSDPIVAAELRLINVRMREPSVYGQTVLPILLDGDPHSSLTPLLQSLVRVDFRQSAFYFRQLFDMIWRIYSLPFDNPLLEELQASMTPQE